MRSESALGPEALVEYTLGLFPRSSLHGDSNPSTYRWILVGFLFCVATLNYADRTAISAVFPLVRADLSLSDVAMGAVGTFFFWSYAVGSPVAGHLADRLSRSGMITFGLAAWSAITLATGFVSSTRELLLTRALLGLAECTYLPAAIALIVDFHGRSTRATALAIHHTGLTLGPIAGGLLAGYMGDHVGWRPTFIVLGGVGLALAVLARLLLRDTDSRSPTARQENSRLPRSPAIWSSIVALFRIPSFAILITQASLMAVGLLMFLNWMPLYFQETFNMSLTEAGLAGTVPGHIAATVAVLLGGYYSDRVAAKRLERRMLIQGLCSLAAAPFLLAFLGTPKLAWLLACVFLFSFVLFFGASNESAVLCELLDPGARSTAAGLRNFTNCLGGGVGTLLAGVLKRDYGLGGIFAAFSVIVIVSGCLLLVGYKFFYRRDLAQRSVELEPSLS